MTQNRFYASNRGNLSNLRRGYANPYYLNGQASDILLPGGKMPWNKANAASSGFNLEDPMILSLAP
jgi:hypothetical protein